MRSIDKTRLFYEVDPEYKWAAKQPNGEWAAFYDKPKFYKDKKRWEDRKNQSQQCVFFPKHEPKITPEESLVKRYWFSCF